MKVTVLILSLVVVPSMAANDISTKPHRVAAIVTPTNLQAQPSPKSKKLTKLKINQRVNVYERSRSWYKVNDQQSHQGWLKMLTVRFIEQKRRDTDLGLSHVFDTAVTRQILPTDSTGVRGFDEEDIKKAKEDPKQLARFLQLEQVSPTSLQRFTNQGGLEPNTKVKLPTLTKGEG